MRAWRVPVAGFVRWIVLYISMTEGVALSEILYLGHISPFSGEWAGGRQMEASTIMAFEDVNKDQSVLPGITLERILKNSECVAGVGLRGLVDLLYDSSKPIVGLLGPGMSSGPWEVGGVCCSAASLSCSRLAVVLHHPHHLIFTGSTILTSTPNPKCHYRWPIDFEPRSPSLLTWFYHAWSCTHTP